MIVSIETFYTVRTITMADNSDQVRVEALFWAELLLGDQVIPTTMVSLSMNTIELELNSERPAIGTICSVRVQLHNRQNMELPVTCHGQISKHSKHGVLFTIESADDPDGLENLRNIVLFHAHDPKRAAEDLG